MENISIFHSGPKKICTHTKNLKNSVISLPAYRVYLKFINEFIINKVIFSVGDALVEFEFLWGKFILDIYRRGEFADKHKLENFCTNFFLLSNSFDQIKLNK